jgi:hypothetical protein
MNPENKACCSEFISVLNCYVKGTCEIACCKADRGGGTSTNCGFRMFCNVADVSFLHAVGEGVEMEGRSILENTNSGTISKYNSMYTGTAHLCLKSTGEGSFCCCYLCSLFTSRFCDAVLSKAYVYYRQKDQSRPQQYMHTLLYIR